jgi:hypothetical protein
MKCIPDLVSNMYCTSTMSAGLSKDSISVVDSLGWRKLCLNNPTSASLLWALPKRAIRIGDLLKFGMSKAETYFRIPRAVSYACAAISGSDLAVSNNRSAFNLTYSAVPDLH